MEAPGIDAAASPTTVTDSRHLQPRYPQCNAHQREEPRGAHPDSVPLSGIANDYKAYSYATSIARAEGQMSNGPGLPGQRRVESGLRGVARGPVTVPLCLGRLLNIKADMLTNAGNVLTVINIVS